MITLLKSLLRWGARPLLPFLGWRVPVRLLFGRSRSSGLEVRLLAAGHPRWSQYVIKRLFSDEPRVEQAALVPVWHLQRHLEQRQKEADLTLVGLDSISARFFMPPHDLALPPLVSCWGHVPEKEQLCKGMNSNQKSDMDRVRREGFAGEFSSKAAEFDLFYTRYYKPYIQSRHGVDAQMSPRWMVRLMHRLGGILWVCRDGERLAGDIVVRQGRDIIPVVSGVLDARMDLVRQGVQAAVYVHMLQLAARWGCNRILLGGSRPSLHDGVLRYKSKWLSGLMPHDGHLSASHVILLRWSRLSAPVAEFLAHTSVIHHEQGGFSALWVFPNDLPLTALNLQRQYRALRLRGLHRFRILLPGPPPADFVCPPEVRLIQMDDVQGFSPRCILERFP
jgi:Acetyltransferase (GNAT) domain